jgi:5S rRNA maturation endonuclease (ribonuclease M5)
VARYVGRWGSKLTEAYLPQEIGQDGQLSLSTPGIAVLAVLFDAQKGDAYVRSKPWNVSENHGYATARISREDIEERSGYSINSVIDGIAELKAAGWIEQSNNQEDPRNRKGQFKPAEYTLMNAPAETPLKERGRGNPMLDVMRYFTFPKVLLRETLQRWSFAKMKASERRVYFALAYAANEARSNEFKRSRAVLNKLTDMEGRTVAKALDGLEERGLIWLESDLQSHSISLCDPFIRSPLETPDGDPENDLSNYKTIRNGVTRRASFNLPAEQIEKLIRSLVPNGEPVIRESENIKIRCPFHTDNSPSCSISLKRGGAWHCFGCPARGSLADMVQRLSGSTKIEAAQQIGRAAGDEVAFHRPDAQAIARYEWKDKYGEIVKVVLRYPNKEDGSKDFSQYRPVPGGRDYRVSGLKPMLYNLDLLEMHVPDTVVIVEGEKDADAVTKLGLVGQHGRIIGTTSGHAHSWHPDLVVHLRGRRVIIMPDDDEPGRKFAEQVKAALDAEGVEYRVISFAGTGAKDVSDFLEASSLDALIEMIGRDWARLDSEELQTEYVTNGEPCPTGEIFA